MSRVQDLSLASRQLVLVGAGHTNLHIIGQWRKRPIPGIELTVVSEFSTAAYSGMLTGTLAGQYQPDDMQIDLVRLADHCGARLLVDRAVALDRAEREITCASGRRLRFDAAVVGIGSIPAGRGIWRDHENVLSIKPMQTFLDRLSARLDTLKQERAVAFGTKPLPISIVGGGSAGVEVALCLSVALRRHGLSAQLSVIDAHDEILRGYSPGAIHRARRELERREIRVLVNRRVTEYRDDERPCLVMADGERLTTSLAIWATAASPPPELERFDLPHSSRGFLAVASSLLSIDDAPIFAVGDAADVVGRSVPKAGVYAVREGPILWQNLERHFDGRPLLPFRPQGRFLSILTTGDGRAILQYRGFSSHSRWAWRLKDWIDRRFVAQYRSTH